MDCAAPLPAPLPAPRVLVRPVPALPAAAPFIYPPGGFFLNADHTHSLEKAVEAAVMGFDPVVFDRSSKPFDENVSETKQAVEAVKSINPSIIVEGEIGGIGSGSEIHEIGPKISRLLTTPEEAAQFVTESGIDVLVPAVGTVHGLLRSMAPGRSTKSAWISATTGRFHDTSWWFRNQWSRSSACCLFANVPSKAALSDGACLRRIRSRAKFFRQGLEHRGS